MTEIVKQIPEGGREYIFFKVQYNHYRDFSTAIDNEVRDIDDMRECECVLTLPKSYTPDGTPTPLVMAFHGSGTRVCEAENLIGGLPYAAECVEAGCAALDVNGSEPHGRTIGCLEHLMAAYQAYRYVTKKFNLEKQVLVCGGSMGGQTAVNFINMFPNIVTAAGIFYPRLNMDAFDAGDYHHIGSFDKLKGGPDGSPHSRIVELHHFPSDEWYEPNTIGFNPYKIRSFINKDGERVVIPPCPIKVWHGTADATTDYRTSIEFVNSIRRSGCYAEIHVLEGVGHGMTPVMRSELLTWFKRFI